MGTNDFPYHKELLFKGNNSLPLGANSFLLEKFPFHKGTKSKRMSRAVWSV